MGKTLASAGSGWSRAGRLGLLAVLVLTGVLAARSVSSVDAGFHLRTGEHILSGHGWPRTDPFTYTLGERAYVDTSWGYQVVLALVEQAFGAPGLVLLHVALVLATFVMIYRTVRLASASAADVLSLLLLGALAAEMRYQVRPELLSYALLATTLYLLHRHAEGRPTPLWLLPPIFVVWANCHSLFVLGWAALGCFLAGLFWRHRRLDRRLAAWAAASVAVTIVNPYGWRGLVFPFSLASRLGEENVFGQSIGEFTSPFELGMSEMYPFYPRLPILAFRVLAVLVLLSLPRLFKQKRFWCVLLCAPFLFLSFRMVRNIPLLVVTCMPGAAWGLSLDGALAALRLGAGARRRAATILVASIAVVSLVLALRVYNDGYYIASRRAARFGFGWNGLALPIDAAAYARRADLPGRMLNHLNFGGHLMWAVREPVFIDGRLEVVGERFFERYREILSSANALEAAVARYGVGWIVLPYKVSPRLFDRLSHDRRWELAYVDHLAAIFVRADAGASAPVDESARSLGAPPAPVDLESLPGLGPLPRAGGPGRWLAGLVRRERFPVDPFSRGLLHYFRGDPARAAPSFAQGIRRSSGAYYEMYNNLGSSLFRLGRLREAAACYRVVLDDQPSNRLARRRLSEIDRRLAEGSAPG